MIHLPIDQVGYDQLFYPRVNGHEDWLTVHRYKEALSTHPWKADARKQGAFPCVVVVKATGYEWPYLLLDGLHRLKAFGAAGIEKIYAEVEHLPRSKWLERSVELNIDSKRPLDSGDKRWIATQLSSDGWKPEKIASLLCMEKASYEKLMSTGIQKLTATSAKAIPVGRSNRTINDEHVGFLKSPLQNVTGTANAQKALRAQASVSARESTQIIESFIALLDAKAIDMTDDHIRGRMERVSELLGELMAVA